MDVLTLGSKKLPKLDPFADIEIRLNMMRFLISLKQEIHEEFEHDEVEFFNESSGSEWEGDKIRKAFDIFKNDD